MNELNGKTWPFLETLVQILPKAEIFLVGGAVRDAILNRPAKDDDFVIRNIPITNLIDALATLGRVDLVGKRFGVIKFKPEGEENIYDIALPRKETSRSFSGAYRDFDIQSDHTLPIDVDLARRDFTINAMAFNVITKKLVDPFLGQKDLKEKTIRTVGSAVTRFQEDYSRILRAIRFSCQLDFSLSERTKKAIKKLGPHLQDKIDDVWIVAREVISQEFLKSFDAKSIRTLELLDELNLLEIIFPEVKRLQECEQSSPYHLEGSVYQHTINALSSVETERYKSLITEPITLLAKLGILFHDLGKPDKKSTDKNNRIHFYDHAPAGTKIVSELCNRLRLGSSSYYPFSCSDLSWIVNHHLFSIDVNSSDIKLTEVEEIVFSDKRPSLSLLQVMLADLLGSTTEEGISRTAPIEALLDIMERIAPEGHPPPPLLSGDDMLSLLDIEPGPQIKEFLEVTREEQLQGNISTKPEAEAFIKNYAKIQS